MLPSETTELFDVAPEQAATERDNPDLTQPQLRRRLFGLALPVIGENLLQTMLGVVDTILVARLGAVALAGVGTAMQVIFLVIAALSALSVGASVLVAQAIGADDRERASRLARQALIWSVLVSVPLAIIGIAITPSLIHLFGLAPDVAQVSTDYLHVTFGTITAVTALLIGGGVLRGSGDSRTPMLVTLLANIINVGLAYALIYGAFGAPALGAVGSAWATFISRLVAVVLLIAALWYGRHGVSIRRAGTWWPQVRVARDLLMIGIPAAVEEVLIISAFASLTPIIAGLGTISLAAHRVVLNILSLSFLPGIGFGLAATALVGQSVGARRPAEAEILTRMALRWAIYWMGGLGLIFIPLAAPLIQLFSNDPQMVTAGVGALQITALMQPLWATGMVFAGALRGTGDTRTPLLITGISMWTGVGLGAIGMHLLPPSLTVIWGAFIITGPFEVLCFWLAWRAWRRKHAAVSLPITINSDITAQG